MNKFCYKWFLKDGYPALNIEKHNSTVFSTFACGGGSSMGYKLAGFNVIAANDIDQEMQKVYIKNHNPKYFLLDDIRSLLLKDLPKELYNLDILDGSPPCSTFSMSGSREKAWGKEKKFREGQAMQTLDDLFFDFIALAQKLKPKIVISENVKGLIQGNAKGYVAEIVRKFNLAGYDTQVFLLNASTMGVPQRRQRVFFLSRRKDLKLQEIKLNFNEEQIIFKKIDEGKIDNFERIEKSRLKYYDKVSPGKSISNAHPKGSFFNSIRLSMFKVANTIASGSYLYHPYQKRKLTKNELMQIGSFPLDYDFIDIKPIYLIGMSVPPVMMAQVANQVYEQWLKVL